MNPQPRRQPGWTCTVCGTWNESFRTTCWKADGHPPPNPPKRGRK